MRIVFVLEFFLLVAVLCPAIGMQTRLIAGPAFLENQGNQRLAPARVRPGRGLGLGLARRLALALARGLGLVRGLGQES